MVKDDGQDDIVGDADDDDDLEIGLENVESAAFEVIPKGDYDIVIESCEYKRSNASNQPMWAVRLEVETGDFAGKKLFANLSFSPKALPMTKASIGTFAPELLEGSFKPKQLADNGDLLGKKARVRVIVGTYQGNKNNQVKKWFAPKEQNEFINQ